MGISKGKHAIDDQFLVSAGLFLLVVYIFFCPVTLHGQQRLTVHLSFPPSRSRIVLIRFWNLIVFHVTDLRNRKAILDLMISTLLMHASPHILSCITMLLNELHVAKVHLVNFRIIHRHVLVLNGIRIFCKRGLLFPSPTGGGHKLITNTTL